MQSLYLVILLLPGGKLLTETIKPSINLGDNSIEPGKGVGNVCVERNEGDNITDGKKEGNIGEEKTIIQEGGSNNNNDMGFDNIPREEEKLTHMNATRPPGPKRRPRGPAKRIKGQN